MRRAVNKIASSLELMKDFNTGTTSESENKMIVDFEGKRYVVTLKELDTKNEDMLKDIKTYLY